MKSLNRVNLCLWIILGLAGCSNNPYPEATKFSGTERTPKRQAFPDLILAFPTVLEFTEGRVGSYDYSVAVPKGEPVVEIDGLPAGVVFDTEAKTLSWTPNFTAGNDPQNPEGDSRLYPIRVVLYGSDEPGVVIVRNSTILVRNVTRPLLVWTTQSNELQEGSSFSQPIILASEDGVEPDIKVYSNDIPRGAVIEKDPADPLKYWITYSPGIDDVTRRDARDAKGFYRDITFNLHALAPGSRAGQEVVRWRIRDTRMPVLVTASSELTVSGDLAFSVSGWDQNGEGRPRITMLSSPEMGTVFATTGPSPDDPNLGFLNVSWKDIPRAAFENTFEFRFSFCAYSSAGMQDACVERAVRVNLVSGNHLAPLFDRSQWAMGEVKDIPLGQALTVQLPIIDVDTRSPVTSVRIDHSSRGCEAAWNNGELTVKAVSAGYCQIDITATSEFGLSERVSLFVKVVEAPTEHKIVSSWHRSTNQ